MISELLNEATLELSRANIDSARLDAEVLLAYVIGCKRTDLIMRQDEEVPAEQSAQFDKLIAQRAQRIPISHITGTRGFWTLDIHVTNAVLTPRPETEGIIERAQEAFPAEPPSSILDLGTGSGCIAAALAAEFPRARITATDISPEALEVARTNLAFAADRVEFLLGDLFEAFERCLDVTIARSYDLIVANPPYIPDDDIAPLMPEVSHHEPRLALAGGPDGLAILRQIIKDAPHHLSPGGWLVVEIGIGQAPAVREMLETSGAYSEITIDKDLADIERVVAAKRHR